MITQEHKYQIRKMAERRYANTLYERRVFMEACETLLERLDIDVASIALISQLWNMRQLSDADAKQQILNAITLKR